MQVVLSLAAVRHIALTMNERALGNVEGPRVDTLATRLLFARAALATRDPMAFELDGEQLRAIDQLLTDHDPREGKLPDGTPLLALVELIWKALAGGPNGDRDTHDYATVLTDAGEAVG
jgi:hypothetical protein